MTRAWFAVFALAFLWASTRAEAAWYCEPLQAYYPWVRSCPSPWRSVEPGAGPRNLTIPAAPNATGDAAQTPGSSPAQGDQPTFTAPSSFVRGDVLDQWCRGSTTALLTAVCGDDELRALAVQRLYAFEEAKSRLAPEQQKALIADQNKWAVTYPQTCGLNADVRPSLPLAPQLKDCLEKAGQARRQYLKDYGLPDAEKTAATSPEPAAAPSAAPATPPAAAPATPAPATPSPSTGNTPSGIQSPATASATPKAPATPQNNETRQVATAPVPPAATSAKPTPSDVGPAAAPHRDSSLSIIADFTRVGAMLIALIVVAIWAVTFWLQGRSRRADKTAEPGE